MDVVETLYRPQVSNQTYRNPYNSKPLAISVPVIIEKVKVHETMSTTDRYLIRTRMQGILAGEIASLGDMHVSKSSRLCHRGIMGVYCIFWAYPREDNIIRRS